MTREELKEHVINFFKDELVFEKPQGGTFKIINIGNTKIENVSNEGFQYSGVNKYVPFNTLFECYEQLISTGMLSRTWFNKTFPTEQSGRPCNFTTIGSILVKLKIAKYNSNGDYEKSI